MMKLLLLSLTLITATHGIEALHPSLTATRLNNQEPIIDAADFSALGITSDGENINGPCCIRVPDWIAPADRADPSAVYYLYFGHHGGRYIRMAWAADIDGPWTLFNCGSNDDPRVGGRGVFDDGNGQITFTNGKYISSSHVSSPDVVVDDENRRFLLFFHCYNTNDNTVDGDKWFDTGSQVTFVSSSRTGLNFNGGPDVSSGGVSPGESGTDLAGEPFGLKMTPLGNAYFRTFRYGGYWYAFTNYGPLWKGPATSANPWDANWTHVKWSSGVLSGGGNPVWDDLYEHYKLVGPVAPRNYAGYDGTGSSPYGENAPRTGAPRHFATLMQDDGETLEVWYTSRGDYGERIFRTTMDLSQGSWQTWDTVTCSSNTVHQEMLQPELDWEGANLPKQYAPNGAVSGDNALRDPFLFRDTDGQIYLFYSGKGEEAIGLARIHSSARDGDIDGASDYDETIAGTDPDDPASIFTILEDGIITNTLPIRWLSATNRVYHIDSSTNLADWVPIAENLASEPPTNRYLLPIPAENEFFRLRVENP